ncbi:Cna B-type domain-containing protein [Desulfitobacterium hafniense]|uniref:Cna B-type domain-containing protein n=1 Tax=Desulfitobacterium hafniense TaxID=49338 RepID=UPI00036CEFEA|nr:Cna B-type domain-containing protein [Desulfitobacterium hafniense]
MFWYKSKGKIRIAVLLILTMLMQTAGPIGSVLASTREGSFRILGERVAQGTAALDWELTLDPAAPVTEYSYGGDFTLREEAAGELRADEGTVVGAYRISTEGIVAVSIDQGLYAGLTEPEPEEDQPEGTTPDSQASAAAPKPVFTGTITAPGAAEKPGLLAGLMELLGTGEDVTGLLEVVSISATQEGVDIDTLDTLDFEKPIAIALQVNVPVLGDGGENYVEHGDRASLELAEGFRVTSGAGPFELSHGGKAVGHVTLSTGDSSAAVTTAEIVFNGDEEVFDGEGGWSNVVCTLNATLLYNGPGRGENAQDVKVTLLDKTYTVHVPELPVVLSGEKTGVRDGQFIDWKVKVKAEKGENPGDISGYQFSDDLGSVGEYVADSFKIGTGDDGKDASPPSPAAGYADKKLTYTFPEETTGTRYLFFRTKIDDGIFYSNGSQTITNTAKVFDQEGVEQFSAAAPVSFEVEWIKKEGAVTSFDPGSDTGKITWTITANQLGASLQNAYITDELPDGLEWESAVLKTWDGNAWVASAITFSEEPEDGKYLLGTGDDYTITTPVQLTIMTGLTVNVGHTVQRMTNNATLGWEDREGGIGSGNVSVDIGLNPISKKVGAGGYDPSAHTIPWEVTVKESDVSHELYVLDLLVYGASGFAWNDIGGITVKEGTEQDTLLKLDLDEINELKAKPQPQYNQKYVNNSFEAGSDLGHVVYTLKKDDGQAVADLILVAKNGGTGIDVSSKSQTFTYTSLVTNPDIYARSKGSTAVSNTAVLYSGNTKINEATAQAACASTMLVKDMLTREDAADPAGNKNTSGSAAAQGYNYRDHSVVFRLHVNANNIQNLTEDLTTVDGQSLGPVTLTDTLPEGWEFVNITEEPASPYLLYEGTAGSGGKVTAGDSPNGTDFLSADFSEEGKAEFTFTELTKPYVILLKARPTAATYQDYFSRNRDYTPKNTAALSAANWPSGTEAEQQVTIKSQILSKTLAAGSGTDQGVLTWTVDYKPNEIGRTGALIKDTLPSGLDLRTDAAGRLDIEGNIEVKELTLKTDGAYDPGGSVGLVQGENIFYNTGTRLLQFEIPDPAKGYRLTYKTDVTGNPGESLSNTVELSSDSAAQRGVAKHYSVSEADATATMERSGWIEITKKAADTGALLSGVGFTLFAADGETVIRRGSTGADGKLTLRGLSPGFYQLKETTPPVGFDPIDKVYSVVVEKNGDQVTTTIDGQTGSNSHKITIGNYSTGTVGDLKIEKFLTGNRAEQDKEFGFTLTVEDQADKTFEYWGAGGKADGTLVLDGSGQGSFTLKGGESVLIKNLPKEAEYTVEEEDYSSEGYLTKQEGDQGRIAANTMQTASFTNIRHEITGTKVWIGGPAEKPAIQLQLYRNNEPFEAPVELKGTETPAWSYTWANLEKTAPDGSDYQYRIDEVNTPENYGKSIAVSGDGRTTVITNTYGSPETAVTGGKIWIGGPGAKPTIQLQLYRDSMAFGEPVTLANGQGSYTWNGLDKTDHNGNEYAYRVDEVDVPENYEKTVSLDGLTITNTYVIPKTDVTGTKVWQGGPEAKPAIELQLYRDGAEVGEPVSLDGSEAIPWSHTWSGLDKTDENGVAYRYHVDEVDTPANYRKSISEDGLMVTNSYRSPGGGGDDDDGDGKEGNSKSETKPQEPLPEETPPQENIREGNPPEEDAMKITTPVETPKKGKVEVPPGSTAEVGEPPLHGKVTVDEEGQWHYTPDPDFVGKDHFSIRLIKPDGTEEDILIEIDVEEIPLSVPEAPAAAQGGQGQLPKTGESSQAGFYLAGLFLILSGLALRRKTV